jgi:hypothetical protein
LLIRCSDSLYSATPVEYAGRPRRLGLDENLSPDVALSGVPLREKYMVGNRVPSVMNAGEEQH